MTVIDLLKKIKKLKVKELSVLAEKVENLRNKKIEYNKDKSYKDYCGHETTITLMDLEEAITFCIFHFKGGMKESLGLEICPCSCYCESCEMIPESAIPIRMQELARDMNEENVMNEFIDQYCTKDKDGNIKLAGR